MISSSDSDDLLRLCCLESEEDDGRFRIEESPLDVGCMAVCSIRLDRDCSHTTEGSPAIAARRIFDLGRLGDLTSVSPPTQNDKYTSKGQI
jgi:hypothetical protein